MNPGKKSPFVVFSKEKKNFWVMKKEYKGVFAR